MKDKAKILLVVLESKPYEVTVAYDGDEGLTKARRDRPDLIILDIIMPVKDGFNAAEELKKDSELCNIPVLMLTSFSQKVGETSLSVSQGLTLDTEDYVDKPVSPEELLRRVEKLLKR